MNFPTRSVPSPCISPWWNVSRSDIIDPDPSDERLEDRMRKAITTFLHGYATTAAPDED